MEFFIGGMALGIIAYGIYNSLRTERPTVTVQEVELNNARRKSDEEIKNFYTAADEFKRKYGTKSDNDSK